MASIIRSTIAAIAVLTAAPTAQADCGYDYRTCTQECAANERECGTTCYGAQCSICSQVGSTCERTCAQVAQRCADRERQGPASSSRGSSSKERPRNVFEVPSTPPSTRSGERKPQAAAESTRASQPRERDPLSSIPSPQPPPSSQHALRARASRAMTESSPPNLSAVAKVLAPSVTSGTADDQTRDMYRFLSSRCSR